METLNPISETKKPISIKKVESVSATECANCGTTTTPLWRRGPNGETICNACGLYLKARNTLRPPTLKRTVHKKTQPMPVNSQQNDCGGGTCPGGGQCNGTGGSTSCAGCPAFNQHQVNRQTLICANCRTTTTPLWRRDEQGNTICNACGLYYKLHNVHRPVSMKRSVIKRRKRIIVAQGSDEEETEEDDDIQSQRSTTTTPPPYPMVEKSVPEIEDYVVLKKKKTQPSSSSSSSLSPLSDKAYHPPTLFSKAYSEQPSSSSPPLQQQSFLPPISSERQSSYKLESLFGSRESLNQLPPLSLPPLTPLSQSTSKPSSSLFSSQQQQISSLPPNKGYELADFDQALDRLEHLRRQVRPEQAYALSQLTQSLSDLASKAEALLSLDSLAYSR
ncbi:Siderophore biosynthesis regulatory protein URBS1 [Choanephora cucurbitarum]|uniref:Siderophore biosynthesis regulatory protein URBS1 n=1 Tax=Choanephora cucurbitarum TaxID=101091 RepID=A0A1C7N7F7_9FUNG|nr:Siderophore biosynthesis regulatory protein URBS1 [Choanephora cucurbitarum]